MMHPKRNYDFQFLGYSYGVTGKEQWVLIEHKMVFHDLRSKTRNTWCQLREINSKTTIPNDKSTFPLS
jgi:hypothetical protein